MMSQKRRTFPRRVDSLAELDAPVRDAILCHQPEDALDVLITMPPDTFLTPGSLAWIDRVRVRWYHTPPRVLAFGRHGLTVVERAPGEPLHVCHIPLAQVVSISLITELLHSVLELVWLDGADVARLHIEFNSVGQSVIGAGVIQLRAGFPAQSSPVSVPARIEHFPLKFHNYARMSLLPGEHAALGLFVGQRKPKRRAPFQPPDHPAVPNQALLITPSALIVVTDSVERSKSRYYVAQHWFARVQISDVQVQQDLNLTWLALRFGDTPTGHTVRFALPADAAEQVRAFLTQIDPTWDGVSTLINHAGRSYALGKRSG